MESDTGTEMSGDTNRLKSIIRWLAGTKIQAAPLIATLLLITFLLKIPYDPDLSIPNKIFLSACMVAAVFRLQKHIFRER